jgi:UDP-glucose-4-epimerase GalE
MTTILVTGGAGFIGSHVCKALAETGHQPICFDTLEKGHDWAVRWGPLEQGDIGDARHLDDVFSRHRPSAVIHLAGYIEVGESVKQPDRYLHNNAAKSDVLIDAALRHAVHILVFSSTCAVYGLPQTDLLAETHPIAPISPYAESKARVERALSAAAGRDLRSASLRYFNAAGADPGGAIGEAHDPETHLMPLAVDAALGLGPAVTLLGTDYPTPDGSCIRDFVHVNDLADAHLRAIDWLRRSGGSSRHETFNLGSGSGYSVRQALAETGRIAGKPVPHAVGPRRPGDSPKLVGDIAKARHELGWSPERDLAAQIEDTLRWRRKMPR